MPVRLTFAGRPSRTLPPLLLSLLSAAALQAQGGAAKRPMTFLDAQYLRSAGAPAVSPDGKQLLYTVSTPDWKEATSQSDIHVVATDRGVASSKQLTFTTTKNEGSPRWAPAGGWFVFTSNREAPAASGSQQQLFLMRADGGEARRITNATQGVSTFAFTKDGQWLVYRSGKATEEQLYALPVAKLAAGTPLDSLVPAQLTKHRTGVGEWRVAPDSKRIFFLSADTVDTDERLRREKRFTVNIRNQEEPTVSLWALDLTSASYTTSRLTRDTRWPLDRLQRRAQQPVQAQHHRRGDLRRRLPAGHAGERHRTAHDQ
jgi:dipeptidyl aminopeptidase/acylaminoacyl peptidase